MTLEEAREQKIRQYAFRVALALSEILNGGQWKPSSVFCIT